MGDSVFSIFPDNQLVSGGLKGKAPHSQKRALCDVKNSLLAGKRAAGYEPPRKLVLPSKSDNDCKDSVTKSSNEENPVKSSMKQGEAFTIASDENADFWDKCDMCQSSEDVDFLFEERLPELTTEDINYVAQGLFSLRVEEPSLIPDAKFTDLSFFEFSDDFDIQAKEFPLSPLSLSPEPIPLSDEE